MWYLAEILFAEPRRADRRSYQCESCNVIFTGATAADAYQKAVAWGQHYASEPPSVLQFLGVSQLTIVGEHLGDGVEICGRFFESQDVWERFSSFVPPPESLKAMLWEQGQDTPLEELLGTEQVAQLKRRWGEHE